MIETKAREISEAVQDAIANERERCAKIAEAEGMALGERAVGAWIARKIRTGSGL